MGLRARSATTSGSSRPPAAPTSAPRSSAASRPCPSTGASCRRGPSAPGSRRGARREGRSIGEVGELVITEPMPSMPLCFWGDADGSRYRESYFDMFPGVWRHGDWIEITDRGTAVISGRSDATINRGGIRMGTSEIYRAVLALDEVVDALVARSATRRHRRLHAALRRAPRRGRRSTTSSSPRIRRRIREDCSPRHVPDVVEQITEVPAHAFRQGARAARQAHPARRRADTAVSRDALASPGRARAIRGDGPAAAVRRPPG